MSVPSHIAHGSRRIPRQQRGEERVSALLTAAGSVIAEAGYEAATMSEIAERAGACIGSLYQFFPNKQSVTEALLAKYCTEMRQLWASLEPRAASLTIRLLVTQLVKEAISFIDQRPALLPLLKPSSKRQNFKFRGLLRQRLSRILLATAPHLARKELSVTANVTLELLRGMNELYAESTDLERKTYAREFKDILSCYLDSRLRLLARRKGVSKRK